MTDTSIPAGARVRVLMSTFNGERHIAEQLHSILVQLPPGGCVVVRDDGSTDGTVAAIEAFADERIELCRGANLGFSRSFLTLLEATPPDTDMVMLADQDDHWLPGKVDRAWHSLRACGPGPALYGSAQMLADAALKPLNVTRVPVRPPSFEGALAENIITGCTAALNAPALRLVQRAGVPENVHFHDWWLFLVVSAFGRVVFDKEPSLLYRQHGGNQIGHGAGWLGRQRHIVRFLLRKDWVGILMGQVQAFCQHYGDGLDPAASELIHRHFILGPRGAEARWRMIFGLRRWRDAWWTELAFRLLLVLHKLRWWPPRSRRLSSLA